MNSKGNEPARPLDIIRRRLHKRYNAEKRFKLYGITAIFLSLAFLFLLFVSIIGNGYSAFQQTHLQLEFYFDPDLIDTANPAASNFPGIVKQTLRQKFPQAKKRREKKQLNSLVSTGAAFQLQDMVEKNPGLVGRTEKIWVPADDDVDMLFKGHISRDVPESDRRLSDFQLQVIETLEKERAVRKRFNATFFTAGDSREPELAGILGAMSGSLLTLALTLALSFPIGGAAAVYLEEFAPRNRWVDLIEVNINNLAAVPSIVFGLLGLAVFINFFNLPRSTPVVGGLVLTIMTLPVIIIAS
ncbi:MAG: DUF3333 domain-containing protein, partial [Deltaproteobacteria bacterium]|nr:DUF3333 domain-containing protein [Deltaproteobacteria bacterium]